MYNGLLHAHSGLRWLVLIILLIALINSLIKWLNRSEFKDSDRKINLFTLIFMHTQFLIGVVLYFVSPKVIFGSEMMKDAELRFYGMEHGVLMLIAAILITIAYVKSKKLEQSYLKFRQTFVFYLLALIIIFMAIPWPFETIAGGWF